jgi:hypothetical protein
MEFEKPVGHVDAVLGADVDKVPCTFSVRKGLSPASSGGS